MSRKIFLLCLVALLVLTACAGGAQAQPPATTQPPAPTPLPPSPVPSDTPAPTATRTLVPTPTAPPVKVGPFETSLLVAEWTDKSGGKDLLYPLDPASGQALPAYPPIDLGTQYFDALSPDHHTLAVVKPGSLMLVDLPSWEQQTFQLPRVANVSALAFDSQGDRLAIVYGSRTSQVAIFDLNTQAVTAQGELDFHASQLKFTSADDGLMLYGTLNGISYGEGMMPSGPPRVALLDAGELSLRWSAELGGVHDGIYSKDGTIGATLDLSQPDSGMYLNPGLAFAPDRDVLYVVYPDQDQLAVIDFAAQKVDSLTIQAPLALLERLLAMTAGVAHAKIAQGTSKRAVVSPDGQFLYVVGTQNTVELDGQGNWQVDANPLGLQVIRTSDGARLAQVDTQADDLAISPDGRFLYLSRWENRPWTDVFDTSSQEVAGRLDGILRPVLRMDGQLLLASNDWNGTSYSTSIVDPQSLKVLSKWTGPQFLAWLNTP